MQISHIKTGLSVKLKECFTVLNLVRLFKSIYLNLSSIDEQGKRT